MIQTPDTASRLPTPPPNGFEVIYIDPPWQYSNKGTRASAASNYRVMSLDDLKGMNVKDISAINATLFMWSTAPMLQQAFALAHAWGFEYKTVAFIWAKRNRKANTPFFGMGNWTRANGEICLLFTRGKPKRANASVSQFIWSPILRHSEKPAAVRDRIVKLMGDVPRVEIFSRHEVNGWKRFGDQLLKVGRRS